MRLPVHRMQSFSTRAPLPKLAAELKGPPGPEFLELVKRSQRVGPALSVLLSIIIILMVTKPGA